MSDLSDFEDNIIEIEPKFNKAADHLQKNVDSFDQSDLLQFYGLYKQATTGKCNIPKPGIFSIQAKAKWSSWNNLGDLSKEKAMELYVEKMIDVYPNIDMTVNDNNKKIGRVTVSSLMKNNDEPESNNDIFDFVKEGNKEKVASFFELPSNQNVNELDNVGLGLIHWASDRGDPDILEILLDNSADINLQDIDGQTALHYASSCGHEPCIKLLLKRGANTSITDKEDRTCLNVAFDDNILNVLMLYCI